MEVKENVVWLIEGRITDRKEFDKITDEMVDSTEKENGNLLYWWSLSDDGNVYYDLECYRDSISALHHLDKWAKYSELFKECATIDNLFVYGDPIEELRVAIYTMKPTYMNFYGGFWKNDPRQSDKDIIWMFDGEIIERDKFKESMEILTKTTMEEVHSRTHWWTISPDEKRFNVIERYADTQAVLAHMPTWIKYGHLFTESTQISEYKVLSDLTLEIKNDIISLDPKLLKYYKGYSK